MKNAATGIGLAVLGLGIAINGLNLNGGSTAVATPASSMYQSGPDEPTIVWYGTFSSPPYAGYTSFHTVLRAWSDGTVEGLRVNTNDNCVASRCGDWTVISSPNDDTSRRQT